MLDILQYDASAWLPCDFGDLLPAGPLGELRDHDEAKPQESEQPRRSERQRASPPPVYRARKPRSWRPAPTTERRVPGYNLQPPARRYMGPLNKTFTEFERLAMEPEIVRQVRRLGEQMKGALVGASGLVGLARDFELAIRCDSRFHDGLLTLDVTHLAWQPYAREGRYWRELSRDNCFAILLALEKYAWSIKRRVRLVDVPAPRLLEYFQQLRGYTPQRDLPNCLLDTRGLDPQGYV